MNGKMKNSALHLAWKTERRMRCCPPDNILYGENTKELREHLEHCFYCREELQQKEQYAKMPVFSVEPDKQGRKSPQPGQLWSLKQDLGGWGPKNRYYAPPLVVVVEIESNSVTVLQSCGEMIFAGDDDIPFQHEIKGFMQPWNQYSLCRDDLDTCYGTVADRSIQNILNPETTQTIEIGSLLWFFRQMEVETGYFFSSRAVTQLLAEHESEKGLYDIANINPQVMYRQLCDLGLVFQESIPSDCSVQDILFHARAADDALLLAAADKTTNTDFALCFTMHGEKPENVQITGIHFTHWNPENGFLNVIGQLEKEMPGDAQIYVRLEVGGNSFNPVPGEFGIENDLIWALFQIGNIDVRKGVCYVRILHEQ